jgi:hypothetical protein
MRQSDSDWVDIAIEEAMAKGVEKLTAGGHPSIFAE